MMPASTKMAGQTIGAPNVCMTPSPTGEVPIPYVSIAMLPQATKTSTKVKFMKKEVVIEQSQTPSTTGDPPPATKGVISGKTMGPAEVKKGSVKVKVEGKGCAHLSCVWALNGKSANVPAMAQAVPSQTTVLVSP